MATVVFSRGKRATPPPMPRGDLLLESPPELPPPAAKQTFGAVLRFLPMVAGALAMGIMYSGLAQGGTKLGMGAISGGLMGVSMVGMMLSQMGRGNNDESQELDASRRDYFRYLGQTRRQVRKTAADQRKAVTWRHPAPDTLWAIAGDRRMWERRPDADDFMALRISVGRQQFAKRIVPPESKPVEDLEPLTTGALRRFIRTHLTVPSVPLQINLRGFSRFELVGDVESARRLAYSMVAQVAAWHAPTEVRLMVVASPENADRWSWVKWLPHTQHPTRTDGVGPVRFFATSAMELAQVAEGSQGVASGDPVHVVDRGQRRGISADSSRPPTTTSAVLLTGQRERPAHRAAWPCWTSRRRTSPCTGGCSPTGRADTVRQARPRADGVRGDARPRSARTGCPSSSAARRSQEVVIEAPKDYPTMLAWATR